VSLLRLWANRYVCMHAGFSSHSLFAKVGEMCQLLFVPV
jgi:hypothetical protein